MIHANSKDYESINRDWSQGGILNILKENISNLLIPLSIYINNLGKQRALKLKKITKSFLLLKCTESP